MLGNALQFPYDSGRSEGEQSGGWRPCHIFGDLRYSSILSGESYCSPTEASYLFSQVM